MCTCVCTCVCACVRTCARVCVHSQFCRKLALAFSGPSVAAAHVPLRRSDPAHTDAKRRFPQQPGPRRCRVCCRRGCARVWKYRPCWVVPSPAAEAALSPAVFALLPRCRARLQTLLHRCEPPSRSAAGLACSENQSAPTEIITSLESKETNQKPCAKFKGSVLLLRKKEKKGPDLLQLSGRSSSRELMRSYKFFCFF